MQARQGYRRSLVADQLTIMVALPVLFQIKKIPFSRFFQVLARIIEQGAATERFTDALEVGYRGLGEMACTDAAQEGINAFLQKRSPDYKK